MGVYRKLLWLYYAGVASGAGLLIARFCILRFSGRYSTLRLLVHIAPHLFKGSVKAVASLSVRFLAWSGLYTSHCLPQVVTPAYLNKCLRQHGVLKERNSVSSVEWQQVESGAIGTVWRLKLSYETAVTEETTLDKCSVAQTAAPHSIILKALGITTRDVLVGELVSLYAQEFKCFRELPAILGDQIVPYVWVLEESWHGLGFILMEDLGELEHHKSAGTGCNLDDAMLMFRECGNIHGRTWKNAKLAQQFAPLRPWVWFAVKPFLKSVLSSKNMQLDKFCPHVVKVLKCIQKDMDDPNCNGWLDQHWKRMFGNHCTEAPCFLEKSGEELLKRIPVYCINHWDLRLDNAFFDRKKEAGVGRARFVDWQAASARHPAADLAVLLCDVDPEITKDKKNISKLLHIYAEATVQHMSGDQRMEKKWNERKEKGGKQHEDGNISSTCSTVQEEGGKQLLISELESALPSAIVIQSVLITIGAMSVVDPKLGSEAHVVLTLRQIFQSLDKLLELYNVC